MIVGEFAEEKGAGICVSHRSEDVAVGVVLIATRLGQPHVPLHMHVLVV